MTTTTPLRAARALADVNSGTIIATVEVAAPPERVFRAITTDEVTRWWGHEDRYQTTKYSADLRTGGRWRAEGQGADGLAFFVEGEFLTIEAPRLLVLTWRAGWDPTATANTTVTYHLEAIPGGTRVTLHHEGFAGHAEACRRHGVGWEAVLGWLRNHLAGERAERFFMVRLLPPRPTFMMDMSADERAMMGAHAAYWSRKLDEGTAVLFGPVADPEGGWGLGVLRASDEAAVRAFEAEDPAVASGRGLRYEILPMLTAVYRE